MHNLISFNQLADWHQKEYEADIHDPITDYFECLSFDGCYNYNRLKKEGLLDDKITCYIDDDEVDCETWVKPDSDNK